jgi:tryptophanyl-tRNA synthetase
VAFQLLRYLLHDENKLTSIQQGYSTGDLLTGDLKKKLIDILCELFWKVNERRSTLTEEYLNKFFSLPDQQEETFIMDELFTPSEAIGVVPGVINDSSTVKELLEKFNELFTDSYFFPIHPILKREGLLIDHRDFDQILQLAKDKKTSEFYIFYSHCPSSDSLHLGEIIPLLFVKWLQKCLGDIQVVIHITDDEHYMQQVMGIEAGAIELSKQIGQENKKDIISLGFDPQNTIVFTSFEIMTPFYENICRVQRRVTYNQVKGIFGFTESDWIGKIGFPAVQAAPSFSSGFPEIFEINNIYCQSTTATEERSVASGAKGKKKSGKKGKDVEPTTKSNVTCLIPCAIDQDPYFRMTRDVAPRLGLKKPCLLHSTFFPALEGARSKMSASEPNSAIFVTDNANVVKEKIECHAFCDPTSPDNDVYYQYLRHFHHSQDKLEELKDKFKTKEVDEKMLQKELIDCLVPQLTAIQQRRSTVTDEVLMPFLRRHAFT